MTIDFGGIAKKVAGKALIAMGTGVGGMLFGWLTQVGLNALTKGDAPAELPANDGNPEAIAEMTDAVAIEEAAESVVEVEDASDIVADVLPEGNGA